MFGRKKAGRDVDGSLGARPRGVPGAAGDDVRARVMDLLEDVCGDPVVRERADDDLFGLGLLDSMAAIELLVGIEEEFGVSIAPTEVPRDEMNTANKIVDQVSRRV